MLVDFCKFVFIVLGLIVLAYLLLNIIMQLNQLFAFTICLHLQDTSLNPLYPNVYSESQSKVTLETSKSNRLSSLAHYDSNTLLVSCYRL